MINISFDPGDTTGYAIWRVKDGQAQIAEFGQMSLDELLNWVNVYDKPVENVIIEEFKLFAKRAKQQAGSSMKASQAIGALRSFAVRKGARVHMQPANIKFIALKQTQITMPSQHSQTHQWDAYLHGAYWHIKQGMLKTALQREMELKNEVS